MFRAFLDWHLGDQSPICSNFKQLHVAKLTSFNSTAADFQIYRFRILLLSVVQDVGVTTKDVTHCNLSITFFYSFHASIFSCHVSSLMVYPAGAMPLCSQQAKWSLGFVTRFSIWAECAWTSLSRYRWSRVGETLIYISSLLVVGCKLFAIFCFFFSPAQCKASGKLPFGISVATLLQFYIMSFSNLVLMSYLKFRNTRRYSHFIISSA